MLDDVKISLDALNLPYPKVFFTDDWKKDKTFITEKFPSTLQAGVVNEHETQSSLNMIAEEEDALEEVYEPFLIQIGFLDRTPRGRVATRLAYEHFNLTVPGRQTPLFQSA